MNGGIRVTQWIELVFLHFGLTVRKENDVIQEKIEGEGEYRGSLLWIRDLHRILR
jgi:hypothetical protein